MIYLWRNCGICLVKRSFFTLIISSINKKLARIIRQILMLNANFIIAKTLTPLKKSIKSKPKNNGVKIKEILFIFTKSLKTNNKIALITAIKSNK